MNKYEYIRRFLPEAKEAEKLFGINPLVMLAQGAIESGWATSRLATQHHNLFGITGYGKPNPYWSGTTVALKEGGLSFRTYPSTQHSFLDFARLIRAAYPMAAQVSYHPQAFAQEIAYSKYISESNGDNRENYRSMLISIAATIKDNIHLLNLQETLCA
ncbi:MAG: glucosaminidase domain-containing protein [Tannerellaceae bacterium]|nr:glucosaminidase domain-containing protein [Tannerellaceae bacterium]